MASRLSHFFLPWASASSTLASLFVKVYLQRNQCQALFRVFPMSPTNLVLCISNLRVRVGS